jgi:hypothetical protein
MNICQTFLDSRNGSSSLKHLSIKCSSRLAINLKLLALKNSI